MTILLNLLKSYGGYALIIAIGGGWFLYHNAQEVDKGEAKVVAAQKAADVKEAARVAKVEADDTATIQDLQTRLAGVLTDPQPAVPPHVVVRMCVPAPSVSPNAASTGGSAGPGGDGSAGPGGAVGSGSQEGADIAPMTEKILSDDRAIIQYFQGYVAACQAAGVCKK